MNEKKKIAIIGAGPGGLAAGLLLGHKGFDVHIFEAKAHPGGRCSSFNLGGYKFDVGPTFLIMKYLLEEIFKETERKLEDYVELMPLDPMYRLFFDGAVVNISSDKEKTKQEMEKHFPGHGEGYEQFRIKEKERFERINSILARPNTDPMEILTWGFLKNVPKFALTKSVYDVIGNYAEDERAKLCFTFQAKYLGMSPYECPGAFAIIPYVEHEFGIDHVKGGLAELSNGLAKACTEAGVTFHYSTPVKQVIVENKAIKGVELDGGERFLADETIINADFAAAMNKLVPVGELKKYNPDYLAKQPYSCSVFMMYLGVKKKYDLQFHNVVFAHDYKRNIINIMKGKLTGPDLSFYVRNASLIDETLAPEGKSALYVLVPVPNKFSSINWKEETAKLRKWTIDGMKERLGMDDIEEMIEEEKILTPDDFEEDYHVYQGAVFNLAHDLKHMLWFRPRNKFEELDNCYLVGGGTHPGSGLPTIYQSGKIAADLIAQKYKAQ